MSKRPRRCRHCGEFTDLTLDERSLILQLHRQGTTPVELAERLSVSRQTIHRVLDAVELDDPAQTLLDFERKAGT